MEILVCVKRVPATGARIVLTDNGQAIDTRNLGFTISPHEECAVEAAVQLVEQHGGRSTVLTLGPATAVEQLRDALAVGIDEAILLAAGDEEWGPMATAAAIVEAVRACEDEDKRFDLLLFGNESADSGGYQVGIRVAEALGLPVISGVKGLEIAEDGTVTARREANGGWDIYEVALPAVVTVREGLNLPRYPSVPGRLRAKKKPLAETTPQQQADGLEKIRLVVPAEQGSSVQILGEGVEAVPRIMELLQELRLI